MIGSIAPKLKRPPLRYYGAKWRLAEWLIEHFPIHQCYVEPFGGAMSVLLNKAPSDREVYNDLNGDVVTFFRVLRDREGELMRALELTPFSRLEYKLASHPADDDLERARRFYVRSWQGIGGPRNNNATGWRFENTNARGASTVRDWTNNEHLRLIVQRLRQIQIECDDFERCIQRYDKPGTLFYCDPPYVGSTRERRWREKGYLCDMDEDGHRRLAEVLHDIAGMAIVSGYPSELYDELYQGWRVELHQSRINSLHNGCRMKTEAIWISPAAEKAAKQGRLMLDTEG